MSTDEVRLDKWLWAARFFKTRSLAHDAIAGGKVHVDGSRIKPSRAVRIGQEIKVTSARGSMTVVVTAISEKRGSASIAATLYRETEESILTREKLAEMHRLSATVKPAEKPSSQDRHTLRRIKEGGFGEGD